MLTSAAGRLARTDTAPSVAAVTLETALEILRVRRAGQKRDAAQWGSGEGCIRT